jgi:hypothetical protein
MPRTIPKHETEIVMATDFTGVIDLRVFATHPEEASTGDRRHRQSQGARSA